MNTKIRYDEIIQFIENAVNEGVGDKAGDIAEKLLKEKAQGISWRDMSAVIGFMTGDSLIPYIRSRQMTKAYKALVEDGKKIEIVIDYTGLSDQPTFIKAFRKQFDMSPTEAIRTNDLSLITLPQTWSVISEDDHKSRIYESDEDNEPMNEVLKFGISQTKLNLIREAMELQVVYGFNDEQSEMAFYVSEKYDISLRKAFDFIDDYCLQFYPFNDNEYANLSEQKPLIYAYFTFDMLSISQTVELMNELRAAGVEDITLEDTELIKAYLDPELGFFSFIDLKEEYEFFKREVTGNYTFYDFKFLLGLGFDLESAVEHLHVDIYATTEAEIIAEKNPVSISIWEEDDSDINNYTSDNYNEDFHEEDRNDFFEYFGQLYDDNH